MQHSTQLALRQSLVQHHAFVQRLALRLARDPNEAQDVAQDTFLRALQGERLAPQALRPWLAASIRGITRNQQRGARRRQEREELAARPEAAPVAKLAMRQEVVDAVLRLKDPFRSTVVMTYELGLTPAEIADREGIAEATVRTRLHRAHATLRETLWLEDESGGERRSALALLAASKPSSVRSASLGHGAAVGAAAAACALVASAVWGLPRLQGEAQGATVPVPRKTSSAALASAEPPVSELVPPTLPQEASTPAFAGRTPAQAEEHPYWAAVRAARSSVDPYEVQESPASRALRAKLHAQALTAAPLPHAAGLAEEIRRTLKAAGVAVERLELDIADDSSLTPPEWASAPKELSLAEWLDLVLALHGVRVQWEVFDGALHVAPLDALMPRAVDHSFLLDDLLIEPAQYFEGGAVPHPIYQSTVNVNDVAAGLMELQGAFTSEDYFFEPSPDRSSVVGRALPRQLLRAQRHLDRLRAYRQSLPGEGRNGAPSRAYRNPHDREAASIVARARRSPEGLAEFFGAGKTSRRTVGEVWTPGAQLLRDQPESLTLGVHSGCVIVSAPDESLSFPKASLWMDLRSVLDGQPLPEELVNQSPILAELNGGSTPLRLVPETLRRYLQLAAEPESWNQDPWNRIFVSPERQLYVHQDPWVLDEIERAIELVLGQR